MVMANIASPLLPFRTQGCFGTGLHHLSFTIRSLCDLTNHRLVLPWVRLRGPSGPLSQIWDLRSQISWI